MLFNSLLLLFNLSYNAMRLNFIHTWMYYEYCWAKCEVERSKTRLKPQCFALTVPRR